MSRERASARAGQARRLRSWLLFHRHVHARSCELACEGFAMTKKITKTDAEWRAELTPEQFHVLREKGTERAFTGTYYASHEKGVYLCAGCGQELFSSDAKF